MRRTGAMYVAIEIRHMARCAGVRFCTRGVSPGSDQGRAADSTQVAKPAGSRMNPGDDSPFGGCGAGTSCAMTCLTGSCPGPGHASITVVVTCKDRRIGNPVAGDADARGVAGRDIKCFHVSVIYHPSTEGRRTSAATSKGLIIPVIGCGQG